MFGKGSKETLLHSTLLVGLYQDFFSFSFFFLATWNSRRTICHYNHNHHHHHWNWRLAWERILPITPTSTNKKKPKRISQNNRKIQIQILRYIQHTFTILLIYLSQVLLQCCYYVLNKNNNNNNRKLINIFILFFRFKISSIIRKKRTTRIHSRFKCV